MIGEARRTKKGGRSRRRGGMRGSQNLALNALLTGMVLSHGKRKGKKSRRSGRKSRRDGLTRRR
jgi:hypothetical protein